MDFRPVDFNCLNVDQKLTFNAYQASTVSELRYQAVRDVLMKEYIFYKNDFYSFHPKGVASLWKQTNASI
jgi:hypothetical protein